MFKNKKILAIVPARGGSKGIKNKNLKKINKKSLIQITANVVNKVKQIDCSIISSDSDKIINEAKKHKLTFFRRRPKTLSGDRVGDIDVLNNALKITEKKMNTKFDIILMLQVTSPLRTEKDIIKSINLIINKRLDAVWSVTKVDKKFHPLKQLIIKKKRLMFYDKKGANIIARQQLSNSFIRNGAIYAFSRKSILEKNLLPKKSGYIIMNTKQISIDTLRDLKIAEKLLN